MESNFVYICICQCSAGNSFTLFIADNRKSAFTNMKLVVITRWMHQNRNAVRTLPSLFVTLKSKVALLLSLSLSIRNDYAGSQKIQVSVVLSFKLQCLSWKMRSFRSTAVVCKETKSHRGIWRHILLLLPSCCINKLRQHSVSDIV